MTHFPPVQISSTGTAVVSWIVLVNTIRINFLRHKYKITKTHNFHYTNPTYFFFIFIKTHLSIMALLTFPHFPSNFLSLSRSPNNGFSPSPRRYFTTAATSSGTAILWFKHDLRTDDHPGLLAASEFRSLVPIYIFDHRILYRKYANFHYHSELKNLELWKLNLTVF